MKIFDDSISFWRDRLRASAIHLLLSLGVGILAGFLVFVVWYPFPYREISGGRTLFLLVVTVDVFLGPLITLAIFDRRKPWLVLRRDLTLVTVLQLAALGYGLWTVAMARPVHLVFEIDRFRIVHAIDIPRVLLKQTPADVNALPIAGPTLLGLRPFKNGIEKMEATMAALQGVQLGFRPDLWQSYDATRADVMGVAKPVAELRSRFPHHAARIDAWLANNGVEASAVGFLPLASRKEYWTVLVDARNGDVLGYLPLDSF